jgi:hypothetical protein
MAPPHPSRALLLLLSAGTLHLGRGAPTGKTVEIAPGVFFPAVNLGTCCGSDPKVGIPAWFAAGGTGIDTALDYRDQPEIAAALKAAGRPRSSYFLTTKIPTHRAPGPLTAAYALKQVEEDVKELDVSNFPPVDTVPVLPREPDAALVPSR